MLWVERESRSGPKTECDFCHFLSRHILTVVDDEESSGEWEMCYRCYRKGLKKGIIQDDF